MPLYQCTTRAGRVTDEVRRAVAQEFTRIHCEITGAPAVFVHVVFNEYQPGHHYLAGKPESDTTFIAGTIRSGRSLEQRQRLLRELSSAWHELTGQSEEELVLGISEQEASAVMEAGLIFPEAGAETAWFEQNREKLGFLLNQ
ncbi:tautomerase family protein [Mycobacteroides saopaulense]|uniref:Tautomerase cis-CaaD-like domain-containing protein n=1 Tax=Mycobacteroides saopaulense TaxID=1578165 RepID=A0ABX3C2C9_9MYCO|nr:tautomerase family protein [Mycobacteroides saopaulense]OHT85049.1 hypothetical protein BKG68_14560 [Mycobacteroides saopaulense]OHU11200.1 hypothetical protein BKG73_07600 [Mycobacteroides saopaulense]